MWDELRPARWKSVAAVVTMFGFAVAVCIAGTGTDLVPWPAGREFYYAHPLSVLLAAAIVGTGWAVRCLARCVYSHDRGLVIRKILRTRTIPWDAITDVVMIRVWAPSRFHDYYFVPVVKYLSRRGRRRSAYVGILASYYQSEAETNVEQLHALIAAAPHHRSTHVQRTGARTVSPARRGSRPGL